MERLPQPIQNIVYDYLMPSKEEIKVRFECSLRDIHDMGTFASPWETVKEKTMFLAITHRKGRCHFCYVRYTRYAR